MAEKTILNKIDDLNAERLENLGQKISALGITIYSEEEDSDGDVLPSFSQIGSFDSIDDAPTTDTHDACQERDTGRVDNDQSAIISISEIAAKRAEGSTTMNGTEIIEFSTANGGLAVESKFITGITRMASF